MPHLLPWLGLCSAITLGLFATGAAAEQRQQHHTIVPPNDVKWQPAPPSLRPGAQAALLYGDPSKDGLFAMRLKLPKGYVVAPHSHPRPEVVTVISGALRLKIVDGDHSKEERLTTGTFLAMPPGMVHEAVADEETVLQLNSFGPWDIVYVNPADDPRKGTQ